MINWDEVKVGETEIESNGCPHKKIIIGVFKDYVWVNDRGGNYDTYHKDALADWTIDDPWVEITAECTLVQSIGAADNVLLAVFYNGKAIKTADAIGDKHSRFRFDPGMRVWKRKEGRDE